MATVLKRRPSNKFPMTVKLGGKIWRFGGGFPHCNVRKRDVERVKERHNAKYGRVVEFHEKFPDGWVRKTQAVYLRG